ATGKSQNIVIKASSGLSDDEIENMVKDAEAHAEEDRKFRELVDVRNQADAMLHATEKSLEDLGEKVDAAERATIESAVNDLKDALKGEDKDQIEAKSKALAEASAGMAQKAYEQAQADAGADGDAEGASKAADDVVDAEFEEVDDDKKSA
ncbi:MAG: Hsp70 family protein, partial [Pseudomonadota bacterium]